MNIIGIINNSFPLKTLTTLAIAESIAFVLVIKLNAPPTINKNAIISADCSNVDSYRRAPGRGSRFRLGFLLNSGKQLLHSSECSVS